MGCHEPTCGWNGFSTMPIFLAIFQKSKPSHFFGGRWNIFLNTAHQETKPREGYRFHVAHKI